VAWIWLEEYSNFFIEIEVITNEGLAHAYWIFGAIYLCVPALLA
jgi:hypothetical protein